MKLFDQLHCPECRGRLSVSASDGLRCSGCGRTVPTLDGIADFVGGAPSDAVNVYHDEMRRAEASSDDLLTRIKVAVGGRWPISLGEVIEFGCGCGNLSCSLAAVEEFRGLLVLDTATDALQACRARIAALNIDPQPPVTFATLGVAQHAVRDAVADTIVGTASLSRVADVQAFLAMAHRALRPGGRAAFLVPNRRYHEAMCLAMAEALVQQHACDGVWPEGQHAVLKFLGETRQLLLHQEDPDYLSDFAMKHLFESEALQDLGLEAGFATAEAIPLEPDPNAEQTLRGICVAAGAPESFAETFSGLAVTVGRPFFRLLSRQDSSANTLLWLTKARGPEVRIFMQRLPSGDQAKTNAASIGVAPRWSIELLPRKTPSGLTVTVGGWCLCNVDVRWVRLTLNDVVRNAAVWRPRPDVHEVLNRDGLYHPLNTLCSGLAAEMLFDGVHPNGNSCPFRLEIVLASGLIVSCPTPKPLILDEPMVISH